MVKKVIVTGCSGQAGSYFVDYLLKNTNYDIYGVVRRLSVSNHQNIAHVKDNPRFKLISADLTDGESLYQAIEKVMPDYFINAAAQSFVAESWTSPVNTLRTDCEAIIYILEAIRKLKPTCRFYNFGSSEEFGDVLYSPQDINHPYRARSPYGAAKIAAHGMVKVYRESYNLYAIQGICFNYEGPRRGEEFVTRKITKGVARIKKALDRHEDFAPITLGNLDSRRDWSDCEDFIDGIWRMLNQDYYSSELRGLTLPLHGPEKYLSPRIKEYVLCSGETHSIREFIELAFQEAGIPGVWWDGNQPGVPEAEEYLLADREFPSLATKKYTPLIKIDPKFYRPADVELLLGNCDPIKKELGWAPKTNFKELIKKMVAADIQALT